MKTQKIKFFNKDTPKRLINLSWPQVKERFPLMKSYGDADNDGLKNFRDCKPFDKRRQHEGKNLTKDDYGFKFIYKSEKKKKPTAEELIDELE